jgi:hypothetical protein
MFEVLSVKIGFLDELKTRIETTFFNKNVRNRYNSVRVSLDSDGENLTLVYGPNDPLNPRTPFESPKIGGERGLSDVNNLVNVTSTSFKQEYLGWEMDLQVASTPAIITKQEKVGDSLIVGLYIGNQLNIARSLIPAKVQTIQPLDLTSAKQIIENLFNDIESGRFSSISG